MYNQRDIAILKNHNIEYLEEMLLDEKGQLNVLPYSQLENVEHEHLMKFCVTNGFYSIPTRELIDFLETEIGEKKSKTIEICSGNGVISRELGIIGVDNFMQEAEQIKELYEAQKQKPVTYGENVQKFEAMDGVKRYRPEIVVAAFCTHRYIPTEHWRGGNMFGVNEKQMLTKIKKYIHIGNRKVHDKKPILKMPHREIKEPWILSRSQHKNDNVIWIWE
jgi:hypothetical protein